MGRMTGMQIKTFFRRLFARDTFRRALFLMKYHDFDKAVRSIEKEDYLPFLLVLLLTIVGITIGYFVLRGILFLLKSG
jgi:hypothetical protein